jgi:hypothetical protein
MQSLAVSAAAILVTFAALEWRETRGREHARACRDWRSERQDENHRHGGVVHRLVDGLIRLRDAA